MFIEKNRVEKSLNPHSDKKFFFSKKYQFSKIQFQKVFKLQKIFEKTKGTKTKQKNNQ